MSEVDSSSYPLHLSVRWLLQFLIRARREPSECVFQMNTFDICSRKTNGFALCIQMALSLCCPPPPLTFLVPVFVTIPELQVDFCFIVSQKKVRSNDSKKTKKQYRCFSSEITTPWSGPSPEHCTHSPSRDAGTQEKSSFLLFEESLYSSIFDRVF